MTTTCSLRRVRFDNQAGERLVGDLYLPAGATGDLPALVVTGSWITVKEQMAGLYARRLAQRGFAALAFDFAGYGQSEGTPRDCEDPVRKADDIHAAFSYLEQADGVAADSLGALAICASSGYTLSNAAADSRVRSVGLVAPWLHNPELVAPLYGGRGGVDQRRQATRDARDRYEADGTVLYVPAASDSDPHAAMYGPYAYYLDPGRGAIPEWGNRFAVMAWEAWLTYDPISFAPAVRQPVRIIHSHDAAIPEGTEAFAADLAGTCRLTWYEGQQLDFYDQPAQVDFAVSAMADHFTETLQPEREIASA